MLRLIGDIHGKFKNYLSMIHESPYPTIQVGDYGLGFYPHVDKGLYEVMKNNVQHRFIRGNHDNIDVCKTYPNFIRDGFVEGNAMFVGGALSVDKINRTRGFDWWETEECSYGEFMQILDIYEVAKPEVMITHDCPNSVVETLFGKKGAKTITREVFSTMLEIHRPKLWIFGHWHEHVDMTIDGTRFICVNIDQTIDVDFETFEVNK